MKPRTIDEYIETQPEASRAVLQSVRRTIREAAPDSEETIAYDIPAFKLGGKTVVQFAGWKHHLSLYPVPNGDEAFQRAVVRYLAGKGTLRFPLDEPVPHDLIANIVKHLIAERHRR